MDTPQITLNIEAAPRLTAWQQANRVLIALIIAAAAFGAGIRWERAKTAKQAPEPRSAVRVPESPEKAAAGRETQSKAVLMVWL